MTQALYAHVNNKTIKEKEINKIYHFYVNLSVYTFFVPQPSLPGRNFSALLFLFC
jgi:hypothetical protein